ncbi:peptidoglycan-binding protein [Streptomyces chattanoogensis]|uniref:N-acetylmuramoyl-L-alanine amidase n=1 Tax=Streptomyces chattanoogensis TaxID=66876 RepID=A0A0N0GVG7_9ACTN|nr:peptidoglycan-binding protein [Streptomyces chattanoogensis]KPC59269.1 N-acetylmuramoyl-L-alanine amidase [Streptomyces chattanoogensis]
MATPLTASQLLKALRDEGLVVHEVRNWRRHNRNTKGRWGPVHGVMIHHTVTQGTEASVDLCYDGHADLPGPLCHGVIDKQGEVHLVGNGRANHAGLGDRDVLQAVIDETPLPRDDAADADGNRHFYGFECINLGNGGDPWPEEQKRAIEKVAAALCRAHRWSERSVIGHKEWQPGKVDPRGFTMDGMRERIRRRLAMDPEGPPGGGGGGDTGGNAGGGAGGDGSGGRPVPPKPEYPPYEPFPGSGFFRSGERSAVIAAMGERLIAEGCGHYRSGRPGPDWNEAHRKSYAAWQRKLGFSGKDADGVPGKASWERLRVPNS